MKITQCMLFRHRLGNACSTRSMRPLMTILTKAVATSSTNSASMFPSYLSNVATLPVLTTSCTVVRAFSSESKSTLLDILAREQQEEEDTGNIQMPDELLELKNTIEKSWKIVEDSGATTNLFRIENPSNTKIQVSFHCQDTVEPVDDYDYEDDEGLGGEEGMNDDEEDEEISSPVRFTVTVTKAGRSLNFACFSEFGQVKVDGVSTTSASTAEYVHENQGTLPKVEYQGPDYTELAEDLQEALQAYLDEECGVDNNMATFVAMFTDYREEIHYVDFLKQAQSIVS